MTVFRCHFQGRREAVLHFFFFQKSVLVGDTFVSLLSIKDVFKMTFYHKAYKLIIVFGKQRNVCCEEVAGLERWLEG